MGLTEGVNILPSKTEQCEDIIRRRIHLFCLVDINLKKRNYFKKVVKVSEVG